MQPLIYDVAVSIDGYISSPDGDISQFAHEGPVVDAYLARLQTYACAIMGRRTYEFGYRFGLQPGQNPYPHMKSYVVSQQIDLPRVSDVTQVTVGLKAILLQLRQSADGPLYLCGGGMLAASLLRAGQIDKLRLKRAPIVLGAGTSLFADAPAAYDFDRLHSEVFEDGYVYQEYKINTATDH